MMNFVYQLHNKEYMKNEDNDDVKEDGVI